MPREHQSRLETRQVGRYRVCSELASGGMATVHLGCLMGPVGFSKVVAIKCLHQQFALEPEFVSMFVDEARLASSINHPNVISSLDVVAEQNELLLVMEYVHGETWSRLWRASKQQSAYPTQRVIVRVLCDVLEGLHAAHTASLAGRCLNIVHRDVSPQNIMVGVDGSARLLDFGIAKASSSSNVTRPGQVRGKFAYMAPEQVRSHPVDARTDIFAAGVVLWEGLVGERLFFSSGPRETVDQLLTAPILAPSARAPATRASDISPALDAVVLKALCRDPNGRFASARGFAEALRAVAEEATRAEVGQWVAEVAKEELAQRLELLEALEASALHARVDPATYLTPSGPFSAARLPVPSQPPTGVEAPSWTTHSSSAPTLEIAVRHGRRAWLAAALTTIGIATIATLAITGASRSRSPTLADTSSAAPQHAAALCSTSAPPSAAAVDCPALETPIVQAESLALSPPGPAPAQRSSPEGATRAQRTHSAAAAKGGCEPPYRIDAEGVRRVKTECL